MVSHTSYYQKSDSVTLKFTKMNTPKAHKEGHWVTFAERLNVKVSSFNSVKTINSHDANLGTWVDMIMNPKGAAFTSAKNLVERYRNTKDKNIKLSIPTICPGALMVSRSKELKLEEKIIHRTNWMQFDIDLKDNPHITNASKLRDEISKIVYVAFCSLSVSGNGVWGLVFVKDISRYKEHFKQLTKDFLSRNILLDTSKGSNPTDLRIYSYDPDAYCAEQFRVYDRCDKPLKINSRSRQTSITQTDIYTLVSEVISRKIDIAPDYQSYLKLGFAIAYEFGESGREIYHQLCSISLKYNERDTDDQYEHCLNVGDGRITIGTFIHMCKEYGITFGK